MHNKSNLKILYAFLVLIVAQAHCQRLMCYVCENCAQISDNTPKENCDESFFNKVETTTPPMTTKDTTATTATTDVMTTLSPTTISSTPSVGTTETKTTTPSESTSSTRPPIPTASTVGQPESTTVLPTPPTPGTVAGPIDEVAAVFNSTTITPITTVTTPISTITTDVPNANSTTNTDLPMTTSATETSTTAFGETTFLKPISLSMEPARLEVRQRRAVENAPFTYHCFTVQQQTVNGSLSTSRGCSRVNQTEAVCPTLELVNNTKFNQCTPCSNALCNGSGTIGVSAVAVILGLVCALLLGFPA